MEKVDKPSGTGSAGAVARKAVEAGLEKIEPCDKAFNQETSRLKDADESCDDGVR